MNLNERFGLAQPPGGDGWRPGERMVTPESLTVITNRFFRDHGNHAVIAYMKAVKRGCRISQYLCNSATILWLVDKDGNIRMAIEEAFNPSKQSGTIPILHRNKAASSSWSKLGHPSLLPWIDDGFARVGGELQFTRDGYWEINNKSGRYGLNCGRSKKHLEEVATCLRTLGLEVEPDFIQGL